jgi:hypothetical protein
MRKQMSDDHKARLDHHAKMASIYADLHKHHNPQKVPEKNPLP